MAEREIIANALLIHNVFDIIALVRKSIAKVGINYQLMIMVEGLFCKYAKEGRGMSGKALFNPSHILTLQNVKLYISLARIAYMRSGGRMGGCTRI